MSFQLLFLHHDRSRMIQLIMLLQEIHFYS